MISHTNITKNQKKLKKKMSVFDFSFKELDNVLNMLEQYEAITYTYRYVEMAKGPKGKPIFKKNGKPIFNSTIVPLMLVSVDEVRKECGYLKKKFQKGTMKEVVFETLDGIKCIIHLNKPHY